MQSSQAVLPGLEANLPASHSVHLSCSASALNEPGKQSYGSDEPTEPVDGPRRKQQKGPPKDVYQVERIVGSRTAHGEAQYLIKWKGWGKQHNTWEPLSHLRNLQADIDAYEASR